jgi:DNA mismatch repair protein MutS
MVATHYHELTELADLLEGVANFSVSVREYEDPAGRDSHVVFLHRIVPGRTDKSYGIHVARMAGVPRDVIRRSQAILEDLHKGFSRESQTTQLARRRNRADAQMLLFADPLEQIAIDIGKIAPDDMTGEQALELLRAFKGRLG